MLKLAVFLCLLFLSLSATTVAQEQQRRSWQEMWHEVMSADEPDDEAWDDIFEQLEQLAEHPLDINTATPDELQQLPFLSEQQVQDIIDYRLRYGGMRSEGELRMLASLDYEQLQLLPYFITFGEDNEAHEPNKPHWPHKPHHELVATAVLPLYTRKGDENGYLGYRYRHELRYEMSYGSHVMLGLTGSQDAGEPFFANSNKWGYDNYSYYAQLKDLGRIEKLIVGTFKLSAGKGLVMGSSMMMGKLAALQSMGRRPTALRPHTSRSQDTYLQGIAATLRLSRLLTLTPYASYRPLDATLATDGSATTIVTSGYHRTVQEMAKKNNTHATDAGIRAELRMGGLQAGMTMTYTHLDRRLEPRQSQLYRRYQANGQDFTNVSVDYGYTKHALHFSGETATDAYGHIATLNTLSLQPSGQWGIMAIQRFYSYRYQSLRAYAMSAGGHVQNESGLLVGTTWRPMRRLQLQAYADYAYFPWARYLVSQQSEALDLLVASAYETNNWTLKARYRRQWHQRDNDTKTALANLTDHRARLTAKYAPRTSAWSLQTQIDLAHCGANEPNKAHETHEANKANKANEANEPHKASRGWMLSETATWRHKRWQLWATGAWFSSDSYASRLYLYERQLPHQYGFASYSGRGWRIALLARADMGRWQGHVRIGHTHYTDRTEIGTGLQTISKPYMTEVVLQLRYRW